MINAVLGLLIALGILVTVHEYGHFWVARRFGVKVLRFSVGFGRPIWTKTDRHGTEFALAWIPLGGYVKMLDEREGKVPEEARHQSFNSKRPYQKIAIALAGPIANVLFAVFAFTLMYLIGVRELAPWVDAPAPGTPAAEVDIQRGDVLVEVDGVGVDSFSDIGLMLASRVGDTGTIELTLNREGAQLTRSLEIERWLASEQSPDPLGNLGLLPKMPEYSTAIGFVDESGAAFEGGLRSGDEVVEVNRQAMSTWSDWVNIVRSNPETELDMKVIRNGSFVSVSITPRERVLEDGSIIGFVGAGPVAVAWPEEQLTTVRHWPLQAFSLGIHDTLEMLELSYQMLWKMVTGKVSLKQVGGPISMAQLAGVSVSSGFESFIGFLALISLSLAIVNLLPVPVLDGGHVVIHSIEWALGRPLSEKAQIIGMQMGMAFILSLMLLAFFNDINRIF